MKAKFLILVGCMIPAAIGCGEDEKKGKSFGAPLIKPPVDEATPAALQATGAALSGGIAVEALKRSPQDRLKLALTEQKGAINGGSCNGIIGCSLQAMDTRINEVNARTEESEKKCQGNSPVPYVFAPLDASMTLDVQCNDVFASDATSQGESGLIFGKSETKFSIGMTLNQTDGRFGYAATYDEATGEVNYLEASYWEQGSASRVSLTKLKANRTSKAFEVFYANTADTYGIGCGAHLKSDGKHILIAGAFPVEENPTCDSAPAVELCFEASTLTEVSGACSVSAASFAIASTSYDVVEGGLDDLKTKVSGSKYAEYGTSFTADAK